jgi:hypothetical protein
MKKLLNIYVCLLLIPLIYGCVDPISFETGTDSSQIIIYGHFSQLQQDYTIDISRTSGFGIPPNPISGACVKIMDGIGNFADYQEVEPGKCPTHCHRLQDNRQRLLKGPGCPQQ